MPLFSDYTPLADLDAMCRMGWGDVPQIKIPLNWREMHGPGDREDAAQLKAQNICYRCGIARRTSRQSYCSACRREIKAAEMRTRHQPAPKPKVTGRRGRANQPWTPDLIIDRIEQFMIRTGHAPVATDFTINPQLPSKCTVRTRWGNTSAAVAEARARLNGRRDVA